MYKAIVVDDHPFIRASVKMLLTQEGVEVIAEADNGADAVQLARELLPNLIVLDIAIPKLDGIEVISRITALNLPIKILVLTSQAPEYFSMRCMKAGATGYVSKNNDLNELSKALNAMTSGYTYFPDLKTNSVRKSDIDSSEAERIASLSDRELIVLQQIARGLSNKEIGETMLLSNKTISTYKARLTEKLKVKTVVDLADLVKRNNLI
ncbi:MAG: DNA-binding response regulator [Acinetobacter sp. RIFCSPHIGHO2_12_41_5]|nr:MAG: DNA-binding response regulator [Acinetobacter sp. RIFCSPHIGHO2_12_41_5]